MPNGRLEGASGASSRALAAGPLHRPVDRVDDLLSLDRYGREAGVYLSKFSETLVLDTWTVIALRHYPGQNNDLFLRPDARAQASALRPQAFKRQGS